MTTILSMFISSNVLIFMSKGKAGSIKKSTKTKEK